MKIKLIFLGKKSSSVLLKIIMSDAERIKKYCNCNLTFFSVNNKNQQIRKYVEHKKLISLIDSKNQIISLSKLTFTHELPGLMLVEQLYCSMTVINKHPYHYE